MCYSPRRKTSVAPTVSDAALLPCLPLGELKSQGQNNSVLHSDFRKRYVVETGSQFWQKTVTGENRCLICFVNCVHVVRQGIIGIEGTTFL